MAENRYRDVVGFRIGKWKVCMGCVTTFFLRDVREDELLREKDIQGNGIRCIRCGRKLGLNSEGGSLVQDSRLERPDVGGQRSGVRKTPGFRVGARNDGRWVSQRSQGGRKKTGSRFKIEDSRLGGGF